MIDKQLIILYIKEVCINKSYYFSYLKTFFSFICYKYTEKNHYLF